MSLLQPKSKGYERFTGMYPQLNPKENLRVAKIFLIQVIVDLSYFFDARVGSNQQYKNTVGLYAFSREEISKTT